MMAPVKTVISGPKLPKGIISVRLNWSASETKEKYK